METRKLIFFFLQFKMKGHTGLDQNGTVQIIRNGQILLTGFFLPRFGCTVLHVTLVL